AGYGATDFAWRNVPVDLNYLGPAAQRNQPAFQQLILPQKAMDAESQRELYRLRQRIERDWRQASYNQDSSSDAYISSLSANSIVYKGMPLAENLAKIYPDLTNPIFENISWAEVHQRMSTNTTSTADKAHPYRLIVHNGEINTLTANKIAFTGRMQKLLRQIMTDKSDKSIKNIIQPGASDSGTFDNVLELLDQSGMSLPTALSVMIPSAYGIDKKNHQTILTAAGDISIPWDGPVAMGAIDERGEFAVVLRDRNGLRPVRGVETNSGLVIFGSESGMVAVPPKEVKSYLKIQPGEKFAVNLKTGEKLTPPQVEAMAAAELAPIAEQILERNKNFSFTPTLPDPEAVASTNTRALFREQASAHYTQEALERILTPLVAGGKEALWSMGDDGQLAVFNEKRALDFFYDMMRQAFAQVTNPSVDSINERGGMITIGPDGKRSLNMPNGGQPPLPSPLLFTPELAALEQADGDKAVRLSATYDPNEGVNALKNARRQLESDVLAQVRQGKTRIILSHATENPDHLPIPMPIAVSAAHSALIKNELRDGIVIHAHTEELIETHKTAMLIASGANFVTPYLVEQTIAAGAEAGAYGKVTGAEAFSNYRTGIEDGFLKIIGKMGISVPSAFWGQFTLLGMNTEDAKESFPWTESPISGLTLRHIQERQKNHAEIAKEVINNADATGVYRHPEGTSMRFLKPVTALDDELYEMHIWRPEVIAAVQKVALEGTQDAYRELVKLQRGRKEEPLPLRDLLKVQYPPNGRIPEDQVQGPEYVLDRLCAPGISLGAIAPWIHRDIATAMSNMRSRSKTQEGPKSNTGEGGEATEMRRMEDSSCDIKQMASGRFGVMATYVRDAEVVEIKVAQGAKPGEGGQVPGVKVEGIVAQLRHATPGVGLVSPPPHHDIYSIEDLTQLIGDIKAVNPKARVRVKLVSQPGIGNIAVGVAKARADEIHIAGHSGGTGSSPLSSVQHAGNPVELGLAEVHQALKANDLRDNIRLIADGSVLTGLDVLKLMMLGADEVGIGTAALVALGCVMTHKCHLNVCPAGVATQDPALEKNYHGKPEYLENLFTAIARDVINRVAKLGFERIEEVIGRSDLLQPMHHKSGVDLSRVVAMHDDDRGHASGSRLKAGERNNPPATVDKELGAEEIARKLHAGERLKFDLPIDATKLSVGASVAGEIAQQFILNKVDMTRRAIPLDETGQPDPVVLKDAQANFQPDRLAADALQINFTGDAGQSFGAFTVEGMKLVVNGTANDYVGKSMSGGKLVVRPHAESIMAKATDQHEIAGNTLLYGATGGEAYFAGQVKERFMVRASGARAVVEGCGDYGCEYMSGGVGVILGPTGKHFGSGMKGGLAFVYDADNTAESRMNKSDIKVSGVVGTGFEAPLKSMIAQHLAETNSTKAAAILENWDEAKTKFKLVTPNDIAALAARPLEYKVNMHNFFEGKTGAAKIQIPMVA
ncbi:MAG: glutamate synthase-related protein, partial [Pseudomonadota bacterium]|nr:glutamate synthase-related protein [Pseudomonadota bacterium]